MLDNRLFNAWQSIRSLTTRSVAPLILAIITAGSPSAFGSSPVQQDAVAGLLGKYCADCHTGADADSGLDLTSEQAIADLPASPDIIRSLIEAIDLAYMPPDDSPQPNKEERASLLAGLQKLLATSLQDAESPRTPMRRMNRFQYANAVRDLLGLRVAVFSLPERIARAYGGYFDPSSERMPTDVVVGNRPLGKSQMIEPRLSGVSPFPQDLRAEHGFDTRADHLTLSPLLMESFLTLGRSIVASKEFNHRNVGIWKAFYAEPDGNAVAPDSSGEFEARLRPFLTRAFRSPVDGPTLARYVAYATGLHASGKRFSDCMKEITAAVLSSPRFLYLYDTRTNSGRPEKLGAYELASRLSFFLWGSIPDDQLLAAAESGSLNSDDVLAVQVERMLHDKKLKRFCDSFPTQWLQLEQTIAAIPDADKYPEFYFGGGNRQYRLTMHMALEPLLLFEAVLVEDQPIRQLIDPDFTYRSDLLELWYHGQTVDDLKGASRAPNKLRFSRRNLSDRRYGGVITNAAVLTMTSAPDRTKPISRGAWVSTVVFNSPPPPPPADVPALPESEAEHAPTDGASVAMSLRERILQHQTRTDCASCHQRIDPFGFALENYGPVGEWREQYENGSAIDASGVLFDRYAFSDAFQFKDALLSEHDRFASGFASHLMSYALGREIEASDTAAIEGIVSNAARKQHRIQSYITGVVLSAPFRQKYSPPSPN